MASELFHRGHYNIIAARLRDAWPVSAEVKCTSVVDTASAATLCILALSFARRLKEDREAFDPGMFLDLAVPPAWKAELLEAFERGE